MRVRRLDDQAHVVAVTERALEGGDQAVWVLTAGGRVEIEGEQELDGITGLAVRARHRPWVEKRGRDDLPRHRRMRRDRPAAELAGPPPLVDQPQPVVQVKGKVFQLP